MHTKNNRKTAVLTSERNKVSIVKKVAQRLKRGLNHQTIQEIVKSTKWGY